MLSEVMLKNMLAEPDSKVDMLLDTDMFNETGDQFALMFARLSPERINLKAVTATPFLNNRSPAPADGMLESYDG